MKIIIIIRFIERRHTSTKHQGVRLREKNSIHTWYGDMEWNTLTRFEECNSSMGTCVSEEGWFLEALEGGRSNGCGHWKGQWWWEAIVAGEEEGRWIGDLVKKIMQAW